MSLTTKLMAVLGMGKSPVSTDQECFSRSGHLRPGAGSPFRRIALKSKPSPKAPSRPASR